jgi:rod shape-determining protein MreC
MDALINRYRNVTILLLVILAQLVLVALQVRNDQDVRMLRVWSVTAITPLARVLEGLRSGTFGILKDYILLRDAQEENRRLRVDLDRIKMENVFLKAELATADRAKALVLFQERTPSRTIAARVISTAASANSKVVFVDRGSSAGVQRGMGVVTPDGIVGKIVGAYPTASEVLLVTDAEFAAGVVSQKHQVRGILKGQGYANCRVDYVPVEEKVEVGEMFYSSGDDRIFPKGFPAAVVRVARRGPQFQEVIVEPTGLRRGLEEVLIVLSGVHQPIPDLPVETPVYIAPPPPAAEAEKAPPQPPGGNTEADRLLQRYKAIGEAQNHKFGENTPGSKPVNFNIPLPPPGAPAAAPTAAPAPPAAAAPKPGLNRSTEAAPPPAAPRDPPPAVRQPADPAEKKAAPAPPPALLL